MKIIEVRDGFIKFEADASVYLSSFIKADGTDKSYIAQVNQLRKIGDVSIASAKILFLLVDGELMNYDKTEPSKDAPIHNFTRSILQNSIKANRPVIVGKTQGDFSNIVVDESVFNKKMLISIDSPEILNTITSNLTKQFNNLGTKTLVIDISGNIKSPKYQAGKDFKIPLNTQTLDFMYKSCLNDATSESKSMIVEIFNDLAEYSKTVPFVPFGVLKSIVDEMVDKQHVFRLLVLKNKLAKFEKAGYFASNKSEVDAFYKILANSNSVIDLSKLDTPFMNCYLEYIYQTLEKSDVQILAELSNSVSKKNLKNIITDSKLSTAIIVHSKYQYLTDIRNYFDNFIIEPTSSNNELFKVYSSFLSSMQSGTYIVAGEGLNYIPVVSLAEEINEFVSYNTEPEITENEPEQTEIQEIFDEPEVVDDEPDETEEPIDESEEDIIESSEDFVEEDKPAKSDIIAGIEEKSEQAIESISENLEEIQEIDLFDDADSEETESLAEEQTDVSHDDAEAAITDTQEVQEEFIEPEYSEITEIAEEPQAQEVLSEEVSLDEYEELSEEFSDTEQEEDIPTEEIQELAEDLSTDVEQEDLQTVPVLEEDDNQLVADDELQEAFDDSKNQDIISDELSEDSDLTEITEEEFGSEEIAVELEEDASDMIQEFDNSDSDDDLNVSIDDMNLESESSVIPQQTDEDIESLMDIVELDPSETSDNDIIVDMTDVDENINIDEELDRQIVEDVDKVYTTVKDSDIQEEISDSDLDLIDELNSDEEGFLEELQEPADTEEITAEEGILDQPKDGIVPPVQHREHDSEILEKRESNTPIVPVYDAEIPQEDMVLSDPIQQGDSVVHAKYGNGVVEKMIKYGTKTLFSINFENIGRRLLDPTLTEIKKL